MTMGEKIKTSAHLRVVRKGAETAERSNGSRMTVRGVVEGLGNGDLRTGRLGQYPDTRRRQIRSGLRDGKQPSRLSRPSPRRPGKEDQTHFGKMFLEAEFSICLTKFPLLGMQIPQNNVKMSVAGLCKARQME